MAARIWNTVSERKLLELYATQQFSCSEIADHLGVTQPTVYNHLRRLGLSTNDLPRRNCAAVKVHISDIQKERMRELACKGKFVNEIARDLGITIGPTRRIFRELGLATSTLKKLAIGSRFGALTVVAPVTPKITYKGHRESRSAVRCDCGKEIILFNTFLRSGNRTSCGCGFNRRKPDRDWVRFLHQLKSGARWRDLDFALNLEDVKRLASLPCTYCRSPPANNMRGRRSGRSDGKVVNTYSGIDRIDSAQGYRSGNVVPCCRICNRSKSNLSLPEFVAWLARLGSQVTVNQVLEAAEQISLILGPTN